MLPPSSIASYGYSMQQTSILSRASSPSLPDSPLAPPSSLISPPSSLISPPPTPETARNGGVARPLMWNDDTARVGIDNLKQHAKDTAVTTASDGPKGSVSRALNMDMAARVTAPPLLSHNNNNNNNNNNSTISMSTNASSMDDTAIAAPPPTPIRDEQTLQYGLTASKTPPPIHANDWDTPPNAKPAELAAGSIMIGANGYNNTAGTVSSMRFDWDANPQIQTDTSMPGSYVHPNEATRALAERRQQLMLDGEVGHDMPQTLKHGNSTSAHNNNNNNTIVNAAEGVSITATLVHRDDIPFVHSMPEHLSPNSAPPLGATKMYMPGGETWVHPPPRKSNSLTKHMTQQQQQPEYDNSAVNGLGNLGVIQHTVGSNAFAPHTNYVNNNYMPAAPVYTNNGMAYPQSADHHRGLPHANSAPPVPEAHALYDGTAPQHHQHTNYQNQNIVDLNNQHHYHGMSAMHTAPQYVVTAATNPPQDHSNATTNHSSYNHSQNTNANYTDHNGSSIAIASQPNSMVTGQTEKARTPINNMPESNSTPAPVASIAQAILHGYTPAVTVPQFIVSAGVPSLQPTVNGADLNAAMPTQQASSPMNAPPVSAMTMGSSVSDVVHGHPNSNNNFNSVVSHLASVMPTDPAASSLNTNNPSLQYRESAPLAGMNFENQTQTQTATENIDVAKALSRDTTPTNMNGTHLPASAHAIEQHTPAQAAVAPASHGTQNHAATTTTATSPQPNVNYHSSQAEDAAKRNMSEQPQAGGHADNGAAQPAQVVAANSTNPPHGVASPNHSASTVNAPNSSTSVVNGMGQSVNKAPVLSGWLQKETRGMFSVRDSVCCVLCMPVCVLKHAYTRTFAV
jgi:hypothetical protein